MIIDANTHISANGKWFHTDLDASLQRLLDNVKEAGIGKALVVPLPGLIGNEEQKALVEDHTDVLFSACTFNPAAYENPFEAGEAFRALFGGREKTFVKFHNRFGKYEPEDARFLEVLKVNDQLENPMLVGVCGLLHDRNTIKGIDTSVYFFNLAKGLQRTDLIIMHGGGTQILQIAEMCRDLQHVYFDLSMTLSKYRHTSISDDIKWLCQHYDRRMIWGSDFPEVSIKQALIDFDNTVGNLALEKRDNILGNNIRKLLDMK